VSDCETWADRHQNAYYLNTTVMASEWAVYKARNPQAKLVTINLQASDTAQVPTDTSVLQLGGFSDTVWEVIKSFVEGRPSADHWVKVIEAVQLPAQA
jgi:60 kDa SS-A/Ro ribonucleoprotein